jgi:aminopeptidase N
MQIDLQEPMQITSVTDGNNSLDYIRDGNVYYIQWKTPVEKGTDLYVTIKYHGKPAEALNPPWDGGWIWTKDKNGNPWMTAACQVLGASVWYPCKDHQADEPDSATLSIVVPDTLIGVGNGRLISKTKKNNTVTYTWSVVNPINSYNIIPYIGKYVNWTETYMGENGKLDLSYWVIKGNEEKARSQFTQVHKMLKCFEHWFGPYPFYEDGFKLVETSHLGMEHQSAIAYGNKFANGYLGKDLSGTGWGKKWDFIIVHESGHEWFANNITTKEVADMWVHEGFTNYSEVLFTECEYGKEAGSDYCIGLRRNILNDVPVTGSYGVNAEGSIDMYYKGSNLVHTIRQIINDDEKFRKLLRALNKDFYHKTTTSHEIEQYICKFTGIDLSKVFEQYLRTIKVPVFEYRLSNGKLEYRWNNCVKGFNMPVKIITDKDILLHPSETWKSLNVNGNSVKVDRNFYVLSRKL